MSERFLVPALFACVCLVSAMPALAAEETQESHSWERYKVVVDRNMFIPERFRPVERPRVVFVPRVNPERYFVLTGVALEDDSYVAFVEDSRTGETTRLKVGDSVARGRITEVAFDRVMYEYEGKSAAVELGRRFESALPAEVLAEAAAGEAAAGQPDETGSSTSAMGTGGGSANSILERLRQRRQKELGR